MYYVLFLSRGILMGQQPTLIPELATITHETANSLFRMYNCIHSFINSTYFTSVGQRGATCVTLTFVIHSCIPEHWYEFLNDINLQHARPFHVEIIE